MKLVPHHGVLLKEYVGEILKSFDKFQVVPSSMKIFPTNLNGPLSPMVSRPSEGRAGRDTVRTSYPTPQLPGIQSGLDLADMHYSYGYILLLKENFSINANHETQVVQSSSPITDSIKK